MVAFIAAIPHCADPITQSPRVAVWKPEADTGITQGGISSGANAALTAVVAIVYCPFLFLRRVYSSYVGALSKSVLTEVPRLSAMWLTIPRPRDTTVAPGDTDTPAPRTAS